MSIILKKILGKNKSDYEDDSDLQSKDKKYCDIKFHNHENPEKSFAFDFADPVIPIYYTETKDKKNTPFHKEVETEVIMEPKVRSKKADKKKAYDGDQSLMEEPKNRLVLSQPKVFTWQNKDAYVYRVESKYNDGERPDLEFVIYIPIDTAVKWLNTTIEKTPDYTSEQAKRPDRNVEQAVTKSPEKEIKYGVERDEEPTNNATILWKNEKKSNSSDLDSDEDEKGKKQPKANKIKEKKVKGPKKNKKKARQVITTYESDEDDISLGRLRPQEMPKKPVKIMEKDDIKM